MKKCTFLFLLISLFFATEALAGAGSFGLYPKFQALNDDGSLCAGCQLHTYQNGTSTDKYTYSDSALTTPNTNPIVLDSRGEATVFCTGEYTFKLLDADGAIIWTQDDVTGFGTDQNNIYYVDSTESDQGAAGSGRSLKDIIDSVGTSASATIVFSHSGSGNTTSYVVGTDETVPSNFRLVIEEGALLSPSSGVTLTIYSPENIEAGPRQQIFDGNGNIASTRLGRWEAGWFAVVGDDSTNNGSAFDFALDTIENSGGGILRVSDGIYHIESRQKIPSNTTIEFDPNAIIKRDFADTGIAGATFVNRDFSTGNSKIKISGGQFDLVAVGNIGFHFWFHNVDDVQINGIYITETKTSWSVNFTECTRVLVTDTTILGDTDGSEDGLHFIGCSNIIVDNCHIDSGDDALAFTIPYDTYADAEINTVSVSSIANAQVTNCYLGSTSHDSLKIYIAAGVTGGQTISGIQVSNCSFEYDEQWATIYDETTNQNIYDIRISNIYGEQGASQSGAGLSIEYAKDIHISKTKITGGSSSASNVNVSESDDIYFHNVHFVDDGATTQNVRCTNFERVHFTDCEFDGGVVGLNMTGTSTYPKIIGGSIQGATTGLDPAANVIGITVKGVYFYGNTTNMDTLTDDDSIFADNIGFCGPGEVKTARPKLIAVAQDAISFAWQNPFAEEIIIKRLIVDVTTGSTAAATMDIGVVNGATDTGDDILDGIDIQNAGIYDSLNDTDNGTNGTGKAIEMSANGGSADYITGKALDASGAGLEGYVYIQYIGK